MYGMGEDDTPPAWATPLIVRQMLWKNYGIGFDDFEFRDVILAIKWQGLEAQRHNYQMDKIRNRKP